MYLILLFIPFLAWLGLAYVAHKNKIADCSYEISMFIAGGFIALWFCIVLVTNLVSFSEQRGLYVTLQKQAENKAIYENKMVNMTAQFKEVLVKAYPNYEKEIFGKMSPEDLQMLFVKYPELKASLTSINYVDKIDTLNADIYDQEIAMRKTVAQIRWNFITPWCITSWMPSVPPNVEKYMK